ncbi:hypothetical protein BDA96_07G152100 [Sorghum bicolor]|uniref:Uncharacterized protein n=1 Tax=Sorghum bicolor TaxID=4558 RepID=A0A921QKV7_SORBI|nr:hypothetical protein BDA96_07G152100 [Sorghum bicolor]
MPSISTAHLATPQPSPPAPHAHLPWPAMVLAARTNPDVLLLHRGIVLNHLGGSFSHTSARTYLGCSLFSPRPPCIRRGRATTVASPLSHELVLGGV